MGPDLTQSQPLSCLLSLLSFICPFVKYFLVPSLGQALCYILWIRGDLDRGLLTQNFPIFQDLFLLCLSLFLTFSHPELSILSTSQPYLQKRSLAYLFPFLLPFSIYGLGYIILSIFQFCKALLTSPGEVYHSPHREGKGFAQGCTDSLTGELGLVTRFSSSPRCKQLIRLYIVLVYLSGEFVGVWLGRCIVFSIPGIIPSPDQGCRQHPWS